jgi:thymidylate kinase
MAKRNGLFIVMYGPEGVGKNRQASLLEERLREKGKLVRRLRYPVYDLKPTGPQLDQIIHHHTQNLPEEAMQQLFAQNRLDFEPTLKSWLDSGMIVISEAYKGTGIVWGITRGMPVERMEEINKDSLEPDVAIYIDGPMREQLPEGHPYGDDEEWYKVRKTYLAMADRYGWIRVGGDAPMLTVANRVWAVVKPVVDVRG